MDKRLLNTSFSQKVMGYFPDFGIYCTYFVEDKYVLKNGYKNLYKKWKRIIQRADNYCKRTNYKTSITVGVGFELWEEWSACFNLPIPKAMGGKEKLNQLNSFLGNTGGDFWFHIKSNDEKKANKLLKLIDNRLKKVYSKEKKPMIIHGNKRFSGKVLGGRFIDGLINPSDNEDISQRVLIGEEDISHQGGSFLITQRFVHDWDKLNQMSELEKENMIGRDHKNRIIPMEKTTSHIKCARQVDNENMNVRLLRQAMPYGHIKENKSKEEGLFFAGYTKSTNDIDMLLSGFAGSSDGCVKDRLFSMTHSKEGSYWYIPNLKECGLSNKSNINREVTMNEYFDVRSKNDYMFYNTKDYQNKIRNSKLVEDCPISDRVLSLIDSQFSRWHNNWYKDYTVPALGELKDHILDEEKCILNSSISLRKGKATQISLSKLLIDPLYSKKAQNFFIDAKELIVGNMPRFSLGTGTQVLEYLTEEEKITGFFNTLNEYSATGHNIPDYKLLVEKGIDSIYESFRSKLIKSKIKEEIDFYQSVCWSLEGLSSFIEAYGVLAKEMLDYENITLFERENLQDISNRMKRIAHKKPQSFVEGLNLVFLVNCALHQVGEPMSIGRLDQILYDLYLKDISSKQIDKNSIQEALDAFWLKMDETVLYNNKHMKDYQTYGTGSIFYSAGNFGQGASINQWVQQVTIGGVSTSNGKDACNELTLMCLRSARRLPMNAPCLSLRVHKNMPKHIYKEAAKAILSGGASPALLNDDKLIPALMDCGSLEIEDARDYACDGCYEPIIPGKSEWAFNNIPVLSMVGMAMNQGATIEGSGPIHLRGLKASWNSPLAEDIDSFEKFLKIYFTHFKWAVNKFYYTLMTKYGSLWEYCPSPLFSAFLDDSLESAKDLTNAGAKYHIVSPLMCGITNTINSLYSIKKLVFDEKTARCSLNELLLALQCNWGEDMKQPFYSNLEGDVRKKEDSIFFKNLRQHSLSLPKFGITSNKELTELTKEVLGTFVKIIRESIEKPIPKVEEAYTKLKSKYSTEKKEFEFVIVPGIGTFAGNVSLGLSSKATADGRLDGQPVADDFTAAPYPSDLGIDLQITNPFISLKEWNIKEINHGIANCAPIDMNVVEDFPIDKLIELIRKFSKGEIGSNMITIGCGDYETYNNASEYPEKYDLVRVRMGGWNEFFISMFDFHQDYIKSRPYYDIK